MAGVGIGTVIALINNTTIDTDQLNTKNSPIAGYFLSNDGTELEWSPITGGLNYKGNWDSLTNSPTIASGVGISGDFYKVSVPSSGVTVIDGESVWEIDDQVLFNGTVWQRIPATSIDNAPIELTGSQTLTQLDTVYLINATVADAVITIPDAVLQNGGKEIQIIKNSGDFNVLISTTTPQFIGNLTAQTISQNGKGFTAISRGSDNSWTINQDSRTSNSVKNITTNYTVTSNDSILLVNGAVEITLPSTIYSGFKLIVKNTANNTITMSSSVLIDDELSKTISNLYDSYEFLFDGNQWWII